MRIFIIFFFFFFVTQKKNKCQDKKLRKVRKPVTETFFLPVVGFLWGFFFFFCMRLITVLRLNG